MKRRTNEVFYCYKAFSAALSQNLSQECVISVRLIMNKLYRVAELLRLLTTKQAEIIPIKTVIVSVYCIFSLLNILHLKITPFQVFSQTDADYSSIKFY